MNNILQAIKQHIQPTWTVEDRGHFLIVHHPHNPQHPSVYIEINNHHIRIIIGLINPPKTIDLNNPESLNILTKHLIARTL